MFECFFANFLEIVSSCWAWTVSILGQIKAILSVGCFLWLDHSVLFSVPGLWGSVFWFVGTGTCPSLVCMSGTVHPNSARRFPCPPQSAPLPTRADQYMIVYLKGSLCQFLGCFHCTPFLLWCLGLHTILTSMWLEHLYDSPCLCPASELSLYFSAWHLFSWKPSVCTIKMDL